MEQSKSTTTNPAKTTVQNESIESPDDGTVLQFNYVFISLLFVILMLYIGLYMGRTMGVIYGITYGIFLDIWIGKSLGLTSIALALIGLISGMFDKTLSKDNRMTVLLMGIVCTIIYEIILYFLQYMAFKTNVEILTFVKILLVEVVYNMLLIIILYPLMNKTGYEIEDEIKGNRILTKYF